MIKKLLTLTILALGLFGQVPSSYNFFAPPPGQVIQVSTSVNGQLGQATYYYFVVASFPIGKSQVSGIGTVANNVNNVLSAMNSVQINWSGVQDATSYDVLRLTVPNFPASGTCTNCLIATGVAALTVTDISNTTLGSYTLNPVPSFSGSILIDNDDFVRPRYIWNGQPGFDLDLSNAQNVLGPGGGVIVPPAFPSGGIGCVQLEASPTTFTGCAGTPALFGTINPGVGSIIRVDSAETTSGSAIQVLDFYTVTPSVASTGQVFVADYNLNMNGTQNFTGNINAFHATIEANTTGSYGSATDPISAGYLDVDVNSNTSGAYVSGSFSSDQIQAGTITLATGVWSWIGEYGGTITAAANFYGQGHGEGNGATVTTNYGYYQQSLVAGSPIAANNFPLWFDEQGVWVLHTTNAFNAVYQARPALYNPQFTKFSIAQLVANSYERGVEQWESNEFVIRTEAGSGAGTLRREGLGGAGIDILTGDVTNPFTMPKTSVAATAPGAAKCDIRLLAGTNAGTGKVVVNCGSSATEITIVDNVGAGF